jgi:hypothetical protein
MKHLLLLFFAVSGTFFAWRYVLSRKDKRLTGQWSVRAFAALLAGLVAAVAVFALFSITSWKLF